MRGRVQSLWVRLMGVRSWLGLFSAAWPWAVSSPRSLSVQWREQGYFPLRMLWGLNGPEVNTPTYLLRSWHAVALCKHPWLVHCSRPHSRKWWSRWDPGLFIEPGPWTTTILPRNPFYGWGNWVPRRGNHLSRVILQVGDRAKPIGPLFLALHGGSKCAWVVWGWPLLSCILPSLKLAQPVKTLFMKSARCLPSLLGPVFCCLIVAK